MRLECRERFPCYRLQRKPPVSDPGMHNGTYTTPNFTYLARGPWRKNRILSAAIEAQSLIYFISDFHSRLRVIYMGVTTAFILLFDAVCQQTAVKMYLKCVHFDWIVTEVCYQGPINWQYALLNFWELISNLMPHFIMNIITHQCWH